MIGRGMRALATFAAVALMGAAAPALACAPVLAAKACVGGACTDAYAAQIEAERANAEAREFGRLAAAAIDRRRDSAGLDEALDVTRILVPNVVAPIALSRDSCSGWVSGEGPDFETADDAARKYGRLAEGQRPSPAQVAAVEALAVLRTRCNAANRRSIATWLATVIDRETMLELWDFLLPRIGLVPPVDAAQSINGDPLLAFVEDRSRPLVAAANSGPAHVVGRRGRAQDYLRNHRNGRLVSGAISGWLARPGATDPAAACPVEAPLLREAEARITTM